MKHIVQKQLAQSIATLQAVLADETIADTLVTIAQLTAQAMQSGRKLLVPYVTGGLGQPRPQSNGDGARQLTVLHQHQTSSTRVIRRWDGTPPAGSGPYHRSH